MSEKERELLGSEKKECVETGQQEKEEKKKKQATERVGRKVRRTLAWLMVCVLCFCIGAAAAHFYEPSGTEEIRVSTSNVRTVIKKAGELISTKYYYKDTGVYENSKEIFKGIKVPFTTDLVVFTYEGVVSLGIDMDKIKIDVNDETQTIILTLPKVDIRNNEIDHESFEYPYEKDSVLNHTNMQNYTELLAQLKNEKAADVLLDKDLMETAKINTQQVLEKFLAGSDMIHGYKIHFEEVDET